MCIFFRKRLHSTHYCFQCRCFNYRKSVGNVPLGMCEKQEDLVNAYGKGCIRFTEKEPKKPP